MVRGLLERHFQQEEIEHSGIWLRVRMARLDPAQRSGWKLHLSATPASYFKLLRRALPLLAAAEFPFKLLSDLDEVERMAAGEHGLMQTGKCVTIYPPSEAASAALAATLAKALRGLAGPCIPTDRRFAADAPVYYRFGPYDGRVEVDAMGQEGRLLWRPDLGRDVWDVTSGGPEEMPGSSCFGDVTAPDHLTFLRERYALQGLLHLSAKGGVFVAEELARPGTAVILKTARAHTNSDVHGRDAMWALRREHGLLRAMAGVPGVPAAGELLESAEANAVARPYLAGKTFWELWIAPNARLPSVRAALRAILDETAEIVAALHARGVVVRDLSPGNILATADGVYLLDLELAHSLDDTTPPYRRGTKGFFDPEKTERVVAVEDDLYSLAVLRGMTADLPVPALLHGVSLDAATAHEILKTEVTRCLAGGQQQSAWNCYEGLASVVHAAQQLNTRLALSGSVIAGLIGAAEAVLHIPGYHFGVGGYAVALGALDRPAEAEALLRRALAGEGAVPDVCQGWAGHLIACMELLEATGRDGFRVLAEESCARVVALAQEEAGRVVWRWPEGDYGDLSGAACHGFGHGLAGVVYALLRCRAVAPQQELIEAGLLSLLRCAERVPGAADALWWPVSAQDSTCWNAWCHGTPGVLKAFAAAARVGLADARVLEAGLRGMYLANNSEACLCHGVGSRVDAVADCLEVPGFGLSTAMRAEFEHDLELLARSLAVSPERAGLGQGLMTGPLGVAVALERGRRCAGHGPARTDTDAL